MTGSTATSSWRPEADAPRSARCCWCSWSAACSTRRCSRSRPRD
jgi:hypothetical protein